ncbi:hypothetical protein LSCM1_07945 [Leishmania martiniquensis]|uniref:Uncharacterized protein n=1 Tax=Leishmania martiniquensis TaxID=1580590 RepID=A0A836HI79_9TRYP|nr:hypothetical protein LSCM1_07945 [Leishmania martiniquensis]
MPPWLILVTIHNVVNVPLSACESGPRSFVVEAHMVLRASACSAPVATATFTTDDVVSTTPNLLEVRLDDATRCTGDGDEGGPKVWRCAVPELQVVVMVKETTHGIRGPSSSYRSDRRAGVGDRNGTRVVGTSAPLRLNAKEIVEADKLTTRIVGTEMGQVGLSFTVDPGDKIGYRQRLESFLRTHNPQGLRLVPNVVEAVSELDTFTKLYRRYSIQNYEERLARFFDVYGPQYKSEIPALLRQWEGREEELMRNLVLDNGPEVTTIDQHQRLTAYLAAYQLDRNSRDVQEILEAHSGKVEASTSVALFSALVERYGPEPDPRTYLFATPRYIPAPSSPPRSRGIPMGALSYDHSHSSLHHGSPSLVRSGAGESAAGAAAPRPCPPTPAPERLYVSVPMSPTPIPQRKAPLETVRSLDRSPSFAVDDAPRQGGPEATMTGDWSERKPVITPKDQVVVSNPALGASRRDVPPVPGSLWQKMCLLLQTQQQDSKPWREHNLFFLDQDEFAATVRALHTFSEAPDGGEVQALVEEWLRRVNQAFRTEALESSDAYYEAAVQDAVRLTGLQPLHLQVVSISSLFHKEQYAGFAAYVEGRSKRAKTERLVLVGDSKRIMDVARFGIHAAVDPVGGSRDALASSSAVVHDPSAAKDGGPFIFLRQPFRHSTEKHSCALLVCDVAVGETYSCPAAMHAPRQGTADFLSKYDSCAYIDEANGPVVAVYSRTQVLPRLILQCIVDPELQPCPVHPDRPVEYYVMESHAFACSRCVVMGAYKGKEVATIEEAAAMARAGLAEVERTVNALKESMLAYANRLKNEESSVPTAPRRLEAEREIDRLQKETEERIRRIRRQVQLEDEAEVSRIHAERIQVQATLEAVDGLGEKLTSALHQRAPVAAVNALQHIQQEGQVEQLMARAQERVPSAPLELVLPLDGPPPTLPPPSSSRPKVRLKGSQAVMGLNESRLPEAAAEDEGESRAPTAAAPPASRAPSSRPTTHASPPPSSLYTQYLSIAGANRKKTSAGAASGSSRAAQANGDSSTVTLTSHPRPVPVTASDKSNRGGEMSSLSSKEALTRGWALLRRGDVAAAHRAWAAVCRAHGTNDVMGTKAHAYIAEAIEKDYAAAAHWYARSLQLDPQDRMTAYNYGVLLEALLDKPQEALRLYDRAAALGDAVAGARARELRSTLAASPGQLSQQTTSTRSVSF